MTQSTGGRAPPYLVIESLNKNLGRFSALNDISL